MTTASYNADARFAEVLALLNQVFSWSDSGALIARRVFMAFLLSVLEPGEPVL
jgi:hypothetical protein